MQLDAFWTGSLLIYCFSLWRSIEFYRFQKLRARPTRWDKAIVIGLIFALPILFSEASYLLPLLLFIHFQQSYRSGGMLQGASDFLGFFMLSLWMALGFRWLDTGTAVEAILLVLSFGYIWAAIAKLRNLSAWQEPHIATFIKFYKLPQLRPSGMAKILPTVLIVFEIALGLSILLPNTRHGAILTALLFHGLIGYSLGLHGFLRAYLLLYSGLLLLS